MPAPCPSCHNTYVRRTRRSFLIKKLDFILPLKRYRCMKCRKRFHVLAAGTHANTPVLSFAGTLLALPGRS